MSISHKFRPLVDAGVGPLAAGEAALAAGNHLGAMARFVSALGPLRQSRSSSALTMKARCKDAIRQILAAIGDEAFGPGHCKHGTATARFTCAACSEDWLDAEKAKIAAEIAAEKKAGGQ